MKAKKWKTERTERFIQEFKSHECLWNKKYASSKYREARELAYKKLADRMRIKNFGVPEVKMKIKSLRGTYFKERKKIQESVRSGCGAGAVYVPELLWYNEMDSLLKIDNEQRSTSDNMMCTRLVNSTMESSTIEKELANFDIEAQISVTVCFDDDSDETPIKTELVTNEDENQEHKSEEINNSVFVPMFEPKPEVLEETSVPDITEELNQYIENIISNNNQVRPLNVTNKGKTENVQDQNQTKQNRKDEYVSEGQNDCNIYLHNDQNVSNNTTSESVASVTITACNRKSVLQRAEATSSSTDVNGLQKSVFNKINAHVSKSLAVLSENLRCIMKAYDYHKQHRTSLESFNNVKYNYFNLSYKTVVDILLPEENNTEFIQSFLYDTLRRARKVAGPYYIRTFKDFANLVYELFLWAKQRQQFCETPHKPTYMNNNLVVNNGNTSTEVDKICISSSGSPRELSGRELGSNKYVQNMAQSSSNEAILYSSSSEISEPQISKNNTDQLKSTAESLTKFAAKYRKNNTKITQNSISTPQVTVPSRNSLNNTHPPSLTSLLQSPPVMPFRGVLQPLQQQQGSQRPPPSYKQFIESQYNEQIQINPQQQISQQPNWTQAPKAQIQQMPQYDVSMNYQVDLNQQQMQLPNMGPSQQYMQQLSLQQQSIQQRQSGRGDPMASIVPPPLPTLYSLHVQPSNNVSWALYKSQSTVHWNAQNNQPTQPNQIQPARQTEWHQELNSIYQAGLSPQQAQKGSPRSASTDSGFISPLNMNMITEQTVSTVPDETETSIPVITHVTSLNDNASFVESGTCAVCKKSTKQMCMGCMKIYYCTYDCQSKDWTAHAQYCTQQPRSNGALQS